ncbi:MAG: Formiminotransferase-cyclodeaminase [Solirubrobacterales bacterium]|nr:Formiminotransferase-cyclodeaminase [Solirubrobacterales bacterium]
MTEFADQPVRAALGAIAARVQPPAAGVASALTCAAAAALAELSAELAADRLAAERGAGDQLQARMRAHGARARELRELLIAAADEDLGAYAAVRAAKDPPQRARALALASDPPLAIAEWAAELAEAASEIAAAGSWAFSADAVVAGRLAAAAARAGEELVAANLGDRDDPRIAKARAAAERAELAVASSAA